MALDDPLHDRQADAGAFELFGRMQPLEDPKQLAGVLHVEPGAVVAHEHDQLACLFDAAHFDRGRSATACEFERIGEQVHEHLPEQQWIALTLRELVDSELERALAFSRSQVGDNALNDLVKRDGPFREGLTTEAAEREQTLYQAIHSPGAIHYVSQHPTTFLG